MFSRPGNPTDNAFIESFNARLRIECLNAHWYMDMDDARNKIESWRLNYSEARPLSSLGNATPAEFAAQHIPSVPAKPVPQGYAQGAG